MIPVVYVAGPYRGANAWAVEQNIHKARQAGAVVAEFGAMPLVPHANTAHYDGIQGDQFWLEGTMELLRRSDAVLAIKGWQQSSGAKLEVEEADRLGKPVFVCFMDLKRWVEEFNA